MGLVEYSDSEEEAEVQRSAKKRRVSGPAKDLSPLPAAFHDLYASNVRTSTCDDPSLHGGRTRSVPHIEGNWNTHVYLEWHPTPTETTTLHNCLKALSPPPPPPPPPPRPSPSTSAPNTHPLHTLLHSDLGAPLPLHISLSRPLTLHTHERDPFQETLRARVRQANVRPFDLAFTHLKWVANHDRTRWFLVLGLGKPPRDELNRLLSACNGAATAAGQPALYQAAVTGCKSPPAERAGRPTPEHGSPKARAEPPASDAASDVSDAFHVSLAWRLSEPGPEVLERMQSREVEAVMDEVRMMSVRFDAVKVKIGNAVTAVELRRRVDASRGILG